jgi:hypothetical protein
MIAGSTAQTFRFVAQKSFEPGTDRKLHLDIVLLHSLE